MARRPNYGFEKRQKEIEKQKKKEAKEERKRLRKEAGGDDVEGGLMGEDDGDEQDEDGPGGA